MRKVLAVCGIANCVLGALCAGGIAVFGFSWLLASGALIFAGAGATLLFQTRKHRVTSSFPFPSVSHGRLPGLKRFTATPVGALFPATRGLGVLFAFAGAAFFCVGSAVLVAYAHPTLGPLMRPRTGRHGRGGNDVMYIVPTMSFLILLGLLCILIGAVLLVGRYGVVLTPDGVFVRAVGRRTWIPWDALTHVWTPTFPIAGRPPDQSLSQALALLADPPNAVVATGIARKLPLNRAKRRSKGGDAGISQPLLRAPVEFVAGHINQYAVNPALRPYLADKTSVISLAETSR